MERERLKSIPSVESGYNRKMTKLTLRLLGKFAASVDTQEIEFATDKVRGLLAFLAVEADKAHTRTQLATLLWGDWDDKGAKANLRKSLFRLKKGLGALADELLTISRSSIEFHAEHAEIDLHQFNRLAQKDDIASLTAAATRYHGNLLAGLEVEDAPEFNEWLTVQRENLHQQYLALLYQLGELHLAQANYTAAQSLAQEQLALESWREGVHRQLMRVFDAQGQRANALAQYDQCREILEQELGVAPSAETEKLVAAIRGEQLLTTHLHNFTAVATPFIGREADINRVIARLNSADVRLITLLGPGGIGKTRLAIEALQRSMGNRSAYFLPLHTVTTQDGVWQLLAEQLEVKPKPYTSVNDAVVRFLRDRAPLLVFDNYEQLLPDTSCIERLLTVVPDVQILVTSRAPLNLRAEWRLPLDGLAVPPEGDRVGVALGEFAAIDLLVQTGQQVRPDIVISADNAPHLIRICRALAGMPLALEMAGSWLNLFTPAQLVAQIEQNLDFLVATRNDMPERHRSLRAVFDYALAQLNSAERELLGQLTVFHGSFSMHAIIAILPASPLAISKLIDHALLQRRSDHRFGLHPVLDAFLREDGLRSADAPSQQELCKRHSHFYLTHLSEQGAMSSATFTTIRRDIDNIRAAWHDAIQRKDSQLLSSAMAGLATLYLQLGYFREGVAMFAAVSLEPGYTQAQAQLEQAKFLHYSGDLGNSIALYQTIIAENQDEDLVAEARGLLGFVYGVINNHSAGLEQGEKLLAYARQRNNQLQLCKALNLLGSIYSRTAQIPLAQAAFEEALPIVRQLDDHDTFSRTAAGLAFLYRELAEFEKASAIAQEGLSADEAAGHLEGIVLHNLAIGLIQTNVGNLSSGIDNLQTARQIAEESEMTHYVCYALYSMSINYLQTGALDKAETLSTRSLTIAKMLRIPQFMGHNLNMLAQIQLRRGDLPQARRLLKQGMQIVDEQELPRVQARLLTTLGELALAENNSDLARQLLTDAMAILQKFQLRVYMPRAQMLLAQC